MDVLEIQNAPAGFAVEHRPFVLAGDRDDRIKVLLQIEFGRKKYFGTGDLDDPFFEHVDLGALVPFLAVSDKGQF